MLTFSLLYNIDFSTSFCLHLKEHGIASVAMESTGDYWQNLFTELLKHGIRGFPENAEVPQIFPRLLPLSLYTIMDCPPVYFLDKSLFTT